MKFLLPILIFCAQSVWAEVRQHGNLIFNLPPDWEMGAVNDGVLTLRNTVDDGPCEYCSFQITAGLKSKGRLDSYLFSERFRFVEAEDRGSIKVLIEPRTTRLGGYDMAMMGQTVDGDLQVLMALKLPERLELILFEGPAGDEETVQQTLATFQKASAPLLENLRFVSEGALPLIEPAQRGELAGLYWGQRTGWMMQLDGTMQMEFYPRSLVFWPNGQFFDGLPLAGLVQPLDEAALLAKGEMDFGHYSLNGDHLVLAFANGTTETLDWRDGAIIEGDRTLYAMEPLADGDTLDGVISSFFYSGFTPGSGLSGGMSSSSSIHFSPDGRYESDSFGGGSSTFDNGGGVTTHASKSSKGAYAIRDGLLTMTPDDGPGPDQRLVFRWGDDIVIGDQFLAQD